MTQGYAIIAHVYHQMYRGVPGYAASGGTLAGVYFLRGGAVQVVEPGKGAGPR